MQATPSRSPRRAATRERILDVAEVLFAEHGIDGTSLRAITRAAGANLASVHYHFGSKDALLDAVIERRAEPLNAARLAELERVESEAGRASVEALLSAFFVPIVSHFEEMVSRAHHLPRLLAQIEALPPETVEPLLREHFGDAGRRFLEAFQRALPELDGHTVDERLRFAAGVMSHVFSGNFDLDVVPGHPPRARRLEEKVIHAIRFLAWGMRAPDPVRSTEVTS
jgi:AcrR family transcriptional regulator